MKLWFWLLWDDPWERGIHGCGTVKGPSGGLEQQPPTNSTSRLQYTAGEASGGVGSEQSLRKTCSRGGLWEQSGGVS